MRRILFIIFNSSGSFYGELILGVLTEFDGITVKIFGPFLTRRKDNKFITVKFAF